MTDGHNDWHTSEVNKLERMFELQDQMQRENFGASPDDIATQGTPEERIAFYKDMHIAITAELQEALDEMGWKPWATSRHFNEEAVQGELVDAFHFFMNLCMVARLEPEQLFAKYLAKRQKNIARQQAGYDGIAGKCPNCKRALDDTAVQCRQLHTLLELPVFWCDEAKAEFFADGEAVDA